jgi:N-acetylmuramoyl-L-alanine amidase
MTLARRSRLALGAVLLLAAAACRPPRNPLAEWLPSKNFNARRPQLVVIHHTAEATFDTALQVLRTRNAAGPASSHYLIGRDGRLGQLVSEDARAWHAGGGSWGPYHDVNSLSIGIELVNTGFEPFDPPQIDRLLVLLEDITRRYNLPRTQIVAHADVDPVRKQDPSGFFPWKLLADKGFGLWPDEDLPEPPPDFEPWKALQVIGYGLKDPRATLKAFHLHYRKGAGEELDAQDRRILFNLQMKHLKDQAPR